MEDNKIIVQVDKTVIKIEGLSIKGLNLQEVERIISNKLNSLVRLYKQDPNCLHRSRLMLKQMQLLFLP
jgi:hypothetical protein